MEAGHLPALWLRLQVRRIGRAERGGPDATGCEGAALRHGVERGHHAGDLGEPFVAAVEDGTTWATQFHPEKSGDAGMQLLSNWLETL